MADLRCPMCGKLNPADSETCQFCQARLKPLLANEAGEIPSRSSAGDSEANLPDWLESLRQFESPESVSDTSQGAESDWLAGLRDQSALGEGETTEPEERENGKEALPEGEPDWLSRISSQQEDQQAQEPAETPDWLSAAEKPAPDVGITTPPDWFPQEQEQQAVPAESLPDWLSDFSPPPAGGQPETAEPDWLSSDRFAPTVPEAEPTGPSKAEAPESQLPDWLSQKETEGPDWLSQGEPVISSVAPSEPEAEKEELSDWLSGLGKGVPDWLSEKEPEAPAAASTEAEVEKPASEELPDWLAGIDEGPKAAEEGAGLPAWMAEEKTPSAEPDWLKEMEATPPETPLEGIGAVESVEVEPAVPFITEEQGAEIEPAFGEALPTWLTEAAAKEALEAAPPKEEEAAGLTPASLPSWLEAMRPVEMVGAATGLGEGVDTQVEGAGPLSGLKGVLPAEPDISIVRKPPAYSAKLRVSEAQQAHADLLSQLMKAEAEISPIPGRPIISPQHVLRIAIAIILILSILLPIVLGIPQFNLPQFTTETSSTSQLVGELPPGAPVLLAIDYQPGLSGEMDAATGAIVDHIMIKGAFLTLVSSLPTGPVQAEHLLAKVNQAGNHQYSAPVQYINLGFVPGGPAGLLGFAEDPRKVIPSALSGEPTWEKEPLSRITSLADFAMVVVATEDPDTARAWIEQVQPTLNTTPMILVVSAQAEPLVRPYYQATPRQIQGMVSGLVSGVAYENMLGRSGNTVAYWAPFSMGMLVAVLLILVGGGINVMAFLLARGKESAGGEAQP
jgi:hypothetical protein